MTKDPVCGMQVDENKAAATSSYQGKKYSFCGQECKNKFDQRAATLRAISKTHRNKASSSKANSNQHQPEHANR